jgi:hypothetical protein
MPDSNQQTGARRNIIQTGAEYESDWGRIELDWRRIWVRLWFRLVQNMSQTGQNVSQTGQNVSQTGAEYKSDWAECDSDWAECEADWGRIWVWLEQNISQTWAAYQSDWGQNKLGGICHYFYNVLRDRFKPGLQEIIIVIEGKVRHFITLI